ncbi:MAG: alpha/beta fold hydrolase [Solirubrobacterales bacterium]|nr:alpha/beta fold hydrolase [Solirubrobacterales bacterium]
MGRAQPLCAKALLGLGQGWRTSCGVAAGGAGGVRSTSTVDEGDQMRVDSGGVGIEYDVSGEGQPIVLIHGFPDTGRLWRHQVPALAEAGFRVIVPDLRGYGRSDKPDAVEAYKIAALAGDVLAVMSDAGVPRAHVVGHDWGAGLAWALAALASDRVDHLAVLSVGHPTTFRAGDGFEQHEKSWYMLLFQFPGVAEEWLSGNGWANFRAWSRHPDADAVIAELESSGALTPGLNYYRANIPPKAWLSPGRALPPIEIPAMGIWSSGDVALTERQMTDSARNVTGPWRYERLDGAGHWMQLEAPDEVNRLLLEFLSR